MARFVVSGTERPGNSRDAYFLCRLDHSVGPHGNAAVYVRAGMSTRRRI